MLATLLRLRFRSLLGGTRRRKRTTGFVAFMGIVYLYLFFCIGMLFYLLFSSICEPFAALGLSWFYFTLAALFGLVFSLVGTVFFAQAQLYNAKDNELLLSLPIPPGTILLSRMVFLWLMDFAMNLLVLLPAALAYAWQIGFTATGYAAQVLLALLLPCLSLALSTLAAWGVSALTRRLGRFKTLMTMVLSLGFLALYFYGYSQMQTLLMLLIANAEALAQAAMGTMLLYHLGLAALGNLPSLLLTAALCLVPMALVYWLLARTFLSFALASQAGGRRRGKVGPAKVSSLPRALFFRELRRLGSSAPYMMNAGTGILMMALLTGAAWLQRDSLGVFFAALPVSPAAAASLAMAFLASMTLFTAPSISLEGKTLWCIQSLPVDPAAVLAAKLRLHVLLGLPPAVLCTALTCAAMGADGLSCLAALTLPAAVTWFTADVGLTMNLLFPRLDWINETAAVKQGASIILTMLISMMAVVGALFLGMLLLRFLPEAAALVVLALVFCLVTLPLRIWLKTRGAQRFAAL